MMTTPTCLKAAAVAALACAGTVLHAQTALADASPHGMFVAAVDREDVADLATQPVTPTDITKGLFPEDLESAEQRKAREGCERILDAGFKCMPPARSYTRYSLPGMNFALGSALLPDGMKLQLRAFAEVLRGRSGQASVRIEGHADASGSSDVNRKLSQDRAESVRSFLVSLGVNPALLVVHGYGADKLRNVADPTAAENRRVEIGRAFQP